jgi:hypothetical protein
MPGHEGEANADTFEFRANEFFSGRLARYVGNGLDEATRSADTSA